MLPTILATLASTFVGQAVTPAPAPAPAPAIGNPFDYQDADQDQPMIVMPASSVGMYGSPQQLPVDTSDYIFGSPHFEQPPAVSFGDPAYGGIIDWTKRQIGGAAQTVGVASAQAANNNKKLIMENRTQINSNRSQIGSLKNNIAQLRRTLTAKNEESTKNKWRDVMLAMAQALPGIRAYNVTHSEQARDMAEHLEDLAKGLEDLGTSSTPITAGTVTAFAASYSDTNANAVLADLVAQNAALIARVNEITADLDELKGLGETLAKSTGDYRKTVQPGDLVSIARLVPSQLDHTDAAVVEAIGKSVLGAAPGTGGSSLSLGLSI